MIDKKEENMVGDLSKELENIRIWEKQYTFDLHAHTKASDGFYEPKDLVKYAKSKKIDVFAITDHDSTLGVSEAIEAGKEYGIHIVSGIEVSTMWSKFQIHIVGLGVDINNEELIELIKDQKIKRDERAKAIGAQLEKCGFKDAYERTKAMAQEGAAITRGNFAAFLYETGAGSTVDRCFKQYLARGCIAYVSASWASIEEAVRVIKASGGIAVLAHPKRYEITHKNLLRLISEFKEWGGEAMEVSGAMQAEGERELLASLCKKHELYASCGSDFHRERNYVDLGINLQIPQLATPIWHHPRFRIEC